MQIKPLLLLLLLLLLGHRKFWGKIQISPLAVGRGDY